ncbi:uncharacterized protein DNG_05698 [Cephalotrichum gorgonifer]|uniref:Peroxin 11C n=1 Tax=Cephalotrichum gorgonifer TaxID=2041049 RepID=A0AAE8SWH8_9PEZI|nr:uncharacterized protein DNG_05698 [Cephalotrichum gorgonifer]
MSSSSSSPAGAKPPKLPLSVILALHPANIDAFLAHLHRCLQTPSGIDSVLLFVGYTSRFAASLLTSAPAAQLQQTAPLLLAGLLASSKPDAAAKIVGAGAAARARTLGAAESLRALSTLITEFRTITRLWALLGMYLSLKRLAGRELSGAGGKLGAFDRAMPWLQLSSGVALQALENGAYLAQRGILKWEPKTIGWAYKWSARFFASCVGLELGRLLVEKVRKEGRGAEKEGAESQEMREWREGWNSAFVRNLAWAPLTIHWSLDKGLVSEMAVGALGAIPGIIQVSKLWRDTA